MSAPLLGLWGREKKSVIALHINVKTILELPGPVSTCMHLSFTSSQLHIIITRHDKGKGYTPWLCVDLFMSKHLQNSSFPLEVYKGMLKALQLVLFCEGLQLKIYDYLP